MGRSRHFGVLIRTKVPFDMDQGIWAGLNPFEHSGHPALGLSLSSPTIDVLVLSRLGIPPVSTMYKVNIYIYF
jgi:hypothetical protein